MVVRVLVRRRLLLLLDARTSERRDERKEETELTRRRGLRERSGGWCAALMRCRAGESESERERRQAQRRGEERPPQREQRPSLPLSVLNSR